MKFQQGGLLHLARHWFDVIRNAQAWSFNEFISCYAIPYSGFTMSETRNICSATTLALDSLKLEPKQAKMSYE